MNALKIVVPVLFAGLMITPAPADACSALRSCVPGPSANAGPYISIWRSSGSLRLDVQPAHAEVYVDGIYAGVAGNFDGVSPGSSVTVGRRRIEVRAEGYEPQRFRARIEKGRTTFHQVALQPVTASR
jgi:hypothetical protein